MSTSFKKISVIVPAYNCENYIKRCIDSLIKQDYKFSEFIIIDDGSTDNTLQIIRNSIEYDSRFIVESQTNSGVSETRNRGLQIATGEFVLFLDSDDYYLHANTLSFLVDMLEKNNADVVVFGHESGNETNVLKVGYEKEILIDVNNNVYNAIKNTLTSPLYRTSVWNKLYRRSLIEDNNIFFYSYKDVISEDCVFNISIFPFLKSILFVPDILYHYEVVEGSLSHQKYYDEIIRRNENTIRSIESSLKMQSNMNCLIRYYYIETLFRISNLAIIHNKQSFRYSYKQLKDFMVCTKDINKKYRKEKVGLIMERGMKRNMYSMLGAFLTVRLNFLVRVILLLASFFRK